MQLGVGSCCAPGTGSVHVRVLFLLEAPKMLAEEFEARHCSGCKQAQTTREVQQTQACGWHALQ